MRILSALMLILLSAVPARAQITSLNLPSIRLSANAKKAPIREDFSFAKFTNKRAVVLLYWNPLVAASIDELRRFDAFAREQKKSSVLYLAAARAVDDHEEDAVVEAMRANDIQLSILLDQQLELGRQIKAQFLPAYYGTSVKGQETLLGFGSLADLAADGRTLQSVLLSSLTDLPVVAAPPPKELNVGDTAPDFTLADMQGRSVKLSSLLGAKKVLLVFWSAYCPHCQREMPRIQKFLDARPGAYTAVSITRIAGVEDQEVTKSYLTQQNIRFPVLLDGGQVSKKYQVKGIPQWMVLDARGKVLTIQTGEKPGLEGLLAHWQ